jgi:hypothetical protein
LPRVAIELVLLFQLTIHLAIGDASAKNAFFLASAPFLAISSAGGRHVVPFLILALIALALGTIRRLTLVFV